MWDNGIRIGSRVIAIRNGSDYRDDRPQRGSVITGAVPLGEVVFYSTRHDYKSGDVGIVIDTNTRGSIAIEFDNGLFIKGCDGANFEVTSEPWANYSSDTKIWASRRR